VVLVLTWGRLEYWKAMTGKIWGRDIPPSSCYGESAEFAVCLLRCLQQDWAKLPTVLMSMLKVTSLLICPLTDSHTSVSRDHSPSKLLTLHFYPCLCFLGKSYTKKSLLL
jgi:hypothetical protein